MLDTGIGPKHVSGFFNALEVPSMHPNALRRRENEVAPYVHAVARASCEDAIMKEINASQVPEQSSGYVQFIVMGCRLTLLKIYNTGTRLFCQLLKTPFL